MKTILFGAGASMPFFQPELSTRHLTDAVNDLGRWNYVISKYKQVKGSNIVVAPATYVKRIIDAITACSPQANFEQIAEVVDKLASYSTSPFPQHNAMNIFEFVIEGLLYGTHKQLPTGLQGIPFLLREIIAGYILELEGNNKVPSYQALIDKQRDFLDYATANDDRASIVSLNYDDCVMESVQGLSFRTGFEDTRSQYGRQLDVRSFAGSKKVIYFPHGHLRFLFTDNDNVTYFPTSTQAEAERWHRLGSSSLAATLTFTQGRFAYNFNTFLTTGQTKDDSLNHLPYATYYQRLAVDLYSSDTLIVIGYSFGDEHFNRLIKSFLEMSGNRELIVIDYYPYAVTMTGEFQDEQNIITKIHEAARTTWSVIATGKGSITPANPAEIAHLNKYGYGYIFDNVLFYKNGYDKFLSEYQQVLQH